MIIKNLTPHDVTIITDNGVITIPVSGIVARVDIQAELYIEINGIKVFKTKLLNTYDLPEPCENTVFIVSRMVAESCKNRNDLLIPNDSIRNEKGQIIGCKSLAKIN